MSATSVNLEKLAAVAMGQAPAATDAENAPSKAAIATITLRRKRREVKKMTLMQFKTRYLGLMLGQARLLAEMSVLEDKKIEPEQLCKNVTTILAILVETEDFLNSLENSCSAQY